MLFDLAKPWYQIVDRSCTISPELWSFPARAATPRALGARVAPRPRHARSVHAATRAADVAAGNGFLFSPTDPNNGLFDTWLYAQPDAADGVPRYYANYLGLSLGELAGAVSTTPRGAMNGVGGAASSDGVHFKDQGVLFRKDPKAKWLGSGSVLKNADGEYVMNFSEDYDCGSPELSVHILRNVKRS